MGGILPQGNDPAALLLIALVVVAAVVVAGTAFLRNRRKIPRWLSPIMVKKRLDVIARDYYRMAEHVGRFSDSEPAAWQPFEHGLASMAHYQWQQAIGHFVAAQSRAGGKQLTPFLNQTGVCLYMQGRLADALKQFDESARIAVQEDDAPGRVSALNNIGVIRHEYGELDSALKYFRAAQAVARDSDNRTAVALCLGNIGNVLREKGELGPALKSLEDGLDLSRRGGDDEGVASGLSSIGSVLRDQGEPDKALERYAEAVETARRSGYKLGATIALCNIGNLYRDKGEPERALKSHESALALAHEIGYRPGVATELGNIGLVLVGRRMYDRAVPYLAESLGFSLTAGTTNGIRQGLYGLSRCDDSLGRERLQALLKEVGLAEETVADTLDRIDQIRSRRPWQRDRQRNPFAPTAR